MTTQHLSDWDQLAEAQRTRQSGQARRSRPHPSSGALASEAADQGRWLTAILRPAGSMDRDGAARARASRSVTWRAAAT